MLGIIPACAGNRPRKYMCVDPKWDHPRVCGEQVRYKSDDIQEEGSSPRVRGTVVAGTCIATLGGIIPACAGNSELRELQADRKRDHPRVCGEQMIASNLSGAKAGSSPRVRGTEILCIIAGRLIGIIPACAGNRHRIKLRGYNAWDHPRVCGEQLLIVLIGQ